MSLAKIFAFETLFDRSIAIILVSLGGVLAGATALVGG
jgi:hypothetical protein